MSLRLTDHEKKMLKGKCGACVAEAMRIQVAVGEAFDAERMVEISRAHEAFGASESSTAFLELFAGLGGRCAVPTTCNPTFDEEYFESVGMPIPKEDTLRSLRSREARRKMGIIPNECCTPYLETNVPRKGEVIAFSESSATPYVNSVCGARTHRESANSALAAAVTGRVPCYGLLLDENRKGNILVKIEARLKDDFDYHLLGYAVGKEAKAGIPVFQSRTSCRPSPEELTSLGAELATSGAVPMYHIVGFTPEAPDEESAFGGKSPEKVLTVTDKDLRKTRELISEKRDKIRVVIFGCPHYNLAQVRDAARLLEGKKIHKGVDLWIMTSSCTKEFARRLGYMEIINKAGGHIISGTCIDQVCWERLYKGEVCMTDSPKGAYYTTHRGISFIVRRRSECIEAALRGGA